ncbi:MAG: cytochrome P450 [Streptosporangiales bacterium]|nr:cytochrome P450 [Streptosporangiales bacterium]
MTTPTPEYPMQRAPGCPFDPPPGLKDLQEQGPVHQVKLWNGMTPWLVMNHADQRKLLRDPRISADGGHPSYPSPVPMPKGHKGGSTVGFILMDDPEHGRLRRMVTAPFAVKKVQAMRPAIQKFVDDKIDEMLAGDKPVDLMQAFALPIPSLVICQLLGVPYDDHEFFQKHSGDILNFARTPEERQEATRALGGYLYQLLEKKLAEPSDDLLSELVTYVRSEEITLPDAVQIAVLLLFAGHETTANMIALGTLAFLEHPDQLALLRDNSDDPKIVSGAVEEMLRYLTITHGGRRRHALEDIEFEGQVIKAGDPVIMPNDIGNRDPEVFADPDRLDITRANAKSHLAFSFGPHNCLGHPLARLELEIVYSTLYRRIPTLKLAKPVSELPFKNEVSIYGVFELPVTW